MLLLIAKRVEKMIQILFRDCISVISRGLKVFYQLLHLILLRAPWLSTL